MSCIKLFFLRIFNVYICHDNCCSHIEDASDLKRYCSMISTISLWLMLASLVSELFLQAADVPVDGLIQCTTEVRFRGLIDSCQLLYWRCFWSEEILLDNFDNFPLIVISFFSLCCFYKQQTFQLTVWYSAQQRYVSVAFGYFFMNRMFFFMTYWNNLNDLLGIWQINRITLFRSL